MLPTIRVLVLDNDWSLRNILRILLSTASTIHLVDEISEIQHLVSRCLELNPHIVLIGGGVKPFIFDIPVILQQISPQTKIVALLNQHDPLRTAALFATHLAGCLFRQEIAENLVPTMHAVAHGAPSFSRAVMQRMVAPQLIDQPPPEPKLVTPSRLTRREQEVLRLLAQGLSNKEMARALSISEKTIEFHLKNLLEKLNVTSRVAAALWVKEQALLPDA